MKQKQGFLNVPLMHSSCELVIRLRIHPGFARSKAAYRDLHSQKARWATEQRLLFKQKRLAEIADKHVKTLIASTWSVSAECLTLLQEALSLHATFLKARRKILAFLEWLLLFELGNLEACWAQQQITRQGIDIQGWRL